METKTLIQSSAKILRITELQKGNVVKYIDKTYSTIEAHFGIVTDLYNSGNETFIQMLLFKKSYNDVTGEVKLFNGSADLALFPATIEEVRADMAGALKGLKEKIDTGEKELLNKREAYLAAESFISGELSDQLTEASFETLTTEEYKEEEKIKQIEAIKEA